MSFLPIVERELRVATRRKSTFWIRSWAPVLTMLFTFSILGMLWLARGGGPVGAPLFEVLTAYAFGLCLLAGVILTANTLSEERQEGTLGLLFLTDLKGYDVVLGKFIACSLNAFYGLLALLPLLGLPLLIGGVTAGEFWRRALSLVNILFLSLATGIWVSAWTHDPRKAMRNTFVLLLVLAGGVPLVSYVLRIAGSSWNVASLAWVSPVFSFVSSDDNLYSKQPAQFWTSLACSQVIAWLFLFHASQAVLRYGEAQSLDSKRGLFSRIVSRKPSRSPKQDKARARRMAKNPIFWLISNESSMRGLIWMIVLGWGALVISLTLFTKQDPMFIAMSAKPCGFLLKMLIALQACRFFVDARRTGSLELLLCSRLRNTEILKGQWLALRQLFFWPLLVFVLLNFMPFALRTFLALPGTGWSRIWSTFLEFGAGSVMITFSTIGMVVDLFAIMWFGMWLALTIKKPSFAPALTILFVLIIPSLLFCGAVFADLFFILWGAIKLQQDLRLIVARQAGRAHRT